MLDWAQRQNPGNRTADSTLAGNLVESGILDSGKVNVRASLLGGLFPVGATFVALIVMGISFRGVIVAWADWVLQGLGLRGLLLVAFLSDLITSPVSPELILALAARTSLAARWASVIGGAAAMAVLAGNTGWLLGRLVRRLSAARPWLERLRSRHGNLLQSNGPSIVAVSALASPLPFSIACWSAGALGLPWLSFFPASTLRALRYVASYALVVLANDLANLFQ